MKLEGIVEVYGRASKGDGDAVVRLCRVLACYGVLDGESSSICSLCAQRTYMVLRDGPGSTATVWSSKFSGSREPVV